MVLQANMLGFAGQNAWFCKTICLPPLFYTYFAIYLYPWTQVVLGCKFVTVPSFVINKNLHLFLAQSRLFVQEMVAVLLIYDKWRGKKA